MHNWRTRPWGHNRRNARKEADVLVLCSVPNDFRLDYGSHVARAQVISVTLSEHDLLANRRPDLAAPAAPVPLFAALQKFTATAQSVPAGPTAAGA
jgi:hypothetical protein